MDPSLEYDSNTDEGRRRNSAGPVAMCILCGVLSLCLLLFSLFVMREYVAGRNQVDNYAGLVLLVFRPIASIAAAMLLAWYLGCLALLRRLDWIAGGSGIVMLLLLICLVISWTWKALG